MAAKPKVGLPQRRKDEIRGIANELLRQIGYVRGAVPVERVAAHMGAVIRYAPYEGELAGVLVVHLDNRIIGVNSAHHKNRQRFTIAHECGHLRLHEGNSFVDRSFYLFNRDENSSKAEIIAEIEANQFAADLLMPYKNILTDIKNYGIDLEDGDQLSKMAKAYGVSAQALSYRIANLIYI